jgi:hypothetical protein
MPCGMWILLDVQKRPGRLCYFNFDYRKNKRPHILERTSKPITK